MTTPHAIIIAAILIVAGGAGAAWLATPRYSMVNAGQGVSIRLDRFGGGMVGCRHLDCAAIAAKPSDPWAEFADAPAEANSQ